MEQVRTQVRITENIYAKVRVLAAIHDVSINQYFINVLSEKIEDWESAHGALPTLPEAEK